MDRIRRQGRARRTRGSWTARLRRALAAIVVGLALLTSGCSAGGDSSSDSGEATGGAADARALQDEPAPAEGEAGGASGSEDSAGTPGRSSVQTRRVISEGTVQLHGTDLAAVREELDRLLGRYGGFVADERTSNDEDGATKRSVLTLRVPSRHFEDVMGAFEEFSTVTDTGRKATDVTTEVIDVAARIRTQEVSLERLRRFLGEASDVNEMIRLESEIASREADLASLRSQQKYLDDVTSLATVTVTMTTPQAVVEEDDALEDAGFLAGLEAGWSALVGALVVGATVVGALLPFVVLLAVLGVPLVVWLRTARRRRALGTPGPDATP